MNRQWYSKDNRKNKVFPIRISLSEERLLKEEAEKQGKSRAMLIREGYLKS